MPEFTDAELQARLDAHQVSYSDADLQARLDAHIPTDIRPIAAARHAAQPELKLRQEGSISPTTEFVKNIAAALPGPYGPGSFMSGLGRGVAGGELESAAQLAGPKFAEAPAVAAKNVLGERATSSLASDRPYQLGAELGKMVPGIVNFPLTATHALVTSAYKGDLHNEVGRQVAGLLPAVGPVMAWRKAMNDPSLSDDEKKAATDRFWTVDLPANAAMAPLIYAGAKHAYGKIAGYFKDAAPSMTPEARQATLDALNEGVRKMNEAATPREAMNIPPADSPIANVRNVDGEWIAGAKVPSEVAQRTGRPVTTVRLFNKDGTENLAAWNRAFGAGPEADAAKDMARRHIANYKGPDVRPGVPVTKEAEYSGQPGESLPEDMVRRVMSEKAAAETPKPAPDGKQQTLAEIQQQVEGSHAEAESLDALLKREEQAKAEVKARQGSALTRPFRPVQETPSREASFQERMAGRTKAEETTRILTPEQARETALPRSVPEEAGGSGAPGGTGPFSAPQAAAAPRTETPAPSFYKPEAQSEVSHYEIGGEKPEPGKIVTPEEASARPSRIITDTSAEASRSVLRRKGIAGANQLLDPETLYHGTKLGLYHIETMAREGARGFDEWSKRMKADHPFTGAQLQQIWAEAKSGKLPPSKQSDLQAAEAILRKPLPTAAPQGRIQKMRAALEGEFLPLDKTDRTLRQNPDIRMGKRFELTTGGAPSMAEADVYDFRQAIEKPLAPTKDINNLETYILAERIKARLADNPMEKHVEGWTSERANTVQRELEAKVGPERFNKIKEVAHGAYQEAMDKALRLQVESGRLSQEVYNHIKAHNPFYAPFQVVRYLTEEGPKGADLGRKIATVADYTKAIKGIHSQDFGLRILDPSANNIVRSRILSEKNKAMRYMADEWLPKDTEGNVIRRLKDGESVPDGFEKVKYLENGKEVTLALRSELAKSVQGLNKAEMGLVERFLRGTAGPFKWGTVGANLGFQAVNYPYDLYRMAVMSKAGPTTPMNTALLPLDIIQGAYDSAMANLAGKMTSRYKAFAQSGAKGGTIAQTMYGDRFGRSLTAPTGKAAAFLKRNTLERVSDFSNAIEEATKMAGFNRLTRAGSMSPEAIASEVRNYAGSPDFFRRGYEPSLNLLQMFMNSRIQGISADLSRLAGRTGKGITPQVYARMAVPAVAVVMNMTRNLSPENRQDYEGIDQWEKDNNIVILKDNYITNSKGVKVRDHWNIPKRDVAGAMFDTLEQSVRLAHDKDPKSFGEFSHQLLQDVSPVNISGKNATEIGQSVMSGLHPFPKALIEGMTNTDLFRHQPIVPDVMAKLDPEFQASINAPEFFKSLGAHLGVSPELLRHTASSMLGSGPMSVFPRAPLEGQPDIIGTPIIGQAIQRFMAHGGQDFTKFYDVYKDAETAKNTIDFLMKQSPDAARAYMQANRKRVAAYYALKPIADALALETKSGKFSQQQGKSPVPMPNLQPRAAQAAGGVQ